MAVDSKHPLYSDRAPDWEQMIETYRGERTVKGKGTKYLPPTDGMVVDGMQPRQEGYLAYQSYLKRSHFPDFVRAAVSSMVGLMHREPATIELPERMEPLRERATAKGEDLGTLLRKINEHQLNTGRFGLLLEAPDGEGPETVPYIAAYHALSMINWDDGVVEQGRQNLEFVVLDESEFERVSDFDWEFKEKYRVLARSSETTNIRNTDQEQVAEGTYVVAELKETTSVSQADFMAPSIAGQTLDFIPFVFVNTKDLIPEPDEPPLLGLSNLALAVYRADADYRQALFMQGQETLVVVGADEDETEEDQPRRVGAGSRLDLPVGGDAKYVGVSASGLEEMRRSLENDKSVASDKGAALLDFSDSSRQSGEALRIRVASKTPTLTTVALTGAAALEESLKQAAIWIGADPDQVSVTPNLDFAEDELTGKDLADLMMAKSMGAPISLQSVHRLMEKKDLTVLDFEEEVKEIEQEQGMIEEEQGTDGVGAEEEPAEEPPPEEEEEQPEE